MSDLLARDASEGAERGPTRQRRRVVTVLFLLGACAILWGELYALTSCVLKLYLGAVTGELPTMALVAVLDWKFVALVAALPLIALGRFVSRRLDLRRDSHPGIKWAAFALTSLLFVGLMVVRPALHEGRQPNRFGFYTNLGPNEDRVIAHESNPSVPPAHVVSNAEGYRDDPWELEKPRRRVLVVGDSFVWGVGIRESSGTLNALIEADLNAGERQPGEPQWAALNVAFKPAGLPYYVESLLAIAPEVKPEAMVISFLGRTDDYHLDVPTMLRGRSNAEFQLIERFRIHQDLMWFNALQRGTHEIERSLFGDWGRDRMRERFDRLVTYAEEHHIRIIVWEHRQADPIFDPFRADPLVTFLSWCDTDFGCAKRCDSEHPCDQPGDQDGWARMDGYYVPHDGHPTERANAVFARLIAAEIRKGAAK